MMNPKLEAFASASIRVETPDGTLFVNILENDKGKPFRVNLTIGKAGTAVSAWAFALQELISALLEKGNASLNDIIVYLSSITTNKYMRLIEGPQVTSGPEGVVVALLKYRNATYKEPDSERRPASFDNY